MSLAHVLSLGRRQATSQWRQPVYRAGWLLAGGLVVTAAAGMAFWLIAARAYAPAVVGANSSAISAMMFLAGVAQLNLMSAVLRFVPGAGAGAARLIARFYKVGAAVSFGAAVVFLLGLRIWTPSLVPLLSPWPVTVSFLVATTVWTLFVLHASALVAVGHAGAATLMNLFFNLSKVLLLLGFATVLPASGIWFSWTVALGAAVTGGVWFLLRRGLPAFTAARRDIPDSVPTPRELVRYVAPDYVAAVAWIACTTLVPILVLDLTAPAHAAVFALCWSICFVLYSVPAAFGQSLVAHGSLDLNRLGERHHTLLFSSLALLAPVVAVLVACAPLILRLFGPWYATQGATTLRVLALSALPNCVVALSVSRARVQKRMRVVAGMMLSLSVVVLGATWLLVPVLGISGGGVAWLLAEVVVAGAIGLSRLPRVLVRAPWPVVSRRRVRHLLQMAPGQWRPEHTPRSVSDTRVVLLSSPSEPAVLKVTGSRGWASLAGEESVLQRLASDPRLDGTRRLLPRVLGTWRDEEGACLLLGRLPGQPADSHRGLPVARWSAPAFEAIAPLHRLGATPALVDADLLAQWVDEPAARLLRSLPRRQFWAAAVGDLRSLLHRELTGVPATVGWTHGDFHPGNLMVDDRTSVCGILDWGGACERSLPDVDLAHWLLTTAARDGGRELGREVTDRLVRPRCWTGPEAALLDRWGTSPCLPDRALLLLAWLGHVGSNLDKSRRYAASPVWMRRNVYPVLRLVKQHGGQP